MQKVKISRGTSDRSLASVNFSSANFHFTYFAAVALIPSERQFLALTSHRPTGKFERSAGLYFRDAYDNKSDITVINIKNFIGVFCY